MDTNRVKKAMEWFYSTVFQDEAIQPRREEPRERTPSAIRAARSLENRPGDRWQSREAVFLKQGKLLAAYEDDYVYDKPVLRYFPTYESLSDQELRGYFSWRSKLRRGQVDKTSLSYAFLYIYELLNQIGVEDPMDGYRKLTDFASSYGKLDTGILLYLNKWLFDYVIYYGLNPALLADTAQVTFDRNVAVLEQVGERDDGEIVKAAIFLSSYPLERSRFYKACREDVDAVIPRVLRRVSEHFAKRCKKTMTEQYFGVYTTMPVSLFESAVFCGKMKGEDRKIAVDGVRTYRFRNGYWSVQKYDGPDGPSVKLGELMKTLDSVMRECYDYRYPIKRKLDTKWIIRIIEEEIRGLLAEKKAAQEKKITIDYSQLAKIRRDAATTQDRLMVDEEPETDIPEVPEETPAFPPQAPDPDTPLSGAEYRLLQCLLYGRDCGWVQAEGLMLSVLADSINEKLLDQFSDSVLTLNDRPELIEDYIEELKEMVHP